MHEWYNVVMKKKWFQILLALGISAAGLVLALRQVRFQDLMAALRQARWGWLLVTTGCMLGSLWFRALRWRMLLEDQVSVGESFGLLNIGYLVSDVLPLRLGDPARAVAVGMRSSVTVVAALSSVVIERTLDLLTVVLFLVLTLPFITVGDSVYAGLASGAAALGLLLTLVLMARFPSQVESLTRRMLVRLPLGDPERWLAPLRDTLEGLQVLRSPRRGALLGLLSLAIWAAIAAFQLTLQQAMLYQAPPAHPLLVAVTATWATALGMAAPSQGGIGGYHAAATWALMLFGVSRPYAAAFGIVGHGIGYLLGVILGAAAALNWGISLREITQTT